MEFLLFGILKISPTICRASFEKSIMTHKGSFKHYCNSFLTISLLIAVLLQYIFLSLCLDLFCLKFSSIPRSSIFPFFENLGNLWFRNFSPSNSTLYLLLWCKDNFYYCHTINSLGLITFLFWRSQTAILRLTMGSELRYLFRTLQNYMVQGIWWLHWDELYVR